MNPAAEPEQLQGFLRAYERHHKEILQPTLADLKALLGPWKRESNYWHKYVEKTRLPVPSPVQRVHFRLKRPESVVDKVFRRRAEFPAGLVAESFRDMYDTLGGRVVVYFLSQLPLIDHELRSFHEQLEILEEKSVAYLSEELSKRLGLQHMVRKEKESGYSSVHYILRLRTSSVTEGKRPWFEVQVRTLAEDVWAEIEHVLGYKPEKRTSLAVRKQFQILSSQLNAVDEHFNFLYEELRRFQDEVTYTDTHPLNAENLPPVLSEVGPGCAQREIDGLLKLLFSRGISTVGDLRARATSRIEGTWVESR